MRYSTLKPGLLISLNTRITGNVSYRRREIEAGRLEANGSLVASWETERTIDDPAEHEQAVKVRGKCRSLITAICSASTFGLLCPDSRTAELEEALSDARQLAEAFNATARLTEISVYMIAGRIASDDAEAARAVNSEVRGLLSDIESGLQRLDVEAVREAANKARALGQMLNPDAAGKLKSAIAAARSAARRIVKAGEAAAVEVDRAVLSQVASARTAFLDLDDAAEVAAPEAVGARAIDLEPSVLSMLPAESPINRPPLYDFE